MLPELDHPTPITSWTNSEKALVHLLETAKGEKIILKRYRPGFASTMFREYVVANYVASRLTDVPKVLGFSPLRRELFFSYVRGQRVLEWVLERFGDKDLVLDEFQNFHGLNPPDHVDSRVAKAFARFRQSMSSDVSRLKQAIKTSYSRLHKIGILHGSADPRNVIYDGERLFIIDFDHARPSLNPRKIEYSSLMYWYGLYPEDH